MQRNTTTPDGWPDDELTQFADELLGEIADDDGTMFGGAKVAEMQRTDTALAIEHKRNRTPPRVHELAEEHGLTGETSHPNGTHSAVIVFEEA